MAMEEPLAKADALANGHDCKTPRTADLEDQEDSEESSKQPFMSSADSLPRQRRGTIPLLEEEIIVDDHFGTKVLIFPKVKAAGGTIDPDAMIAEPMKMCRRIFVRERNWSTHLTIDETFDAFLHGPVSALLYHEIVRAKILTVLHGLGLQVQSFDSIDNDEVFIKVWLDRRGEVVRDLAQRYQYKMPFRSEAYATAQPVGLYPGGRPMKNAVGRPVVAYAEWEPEMSDELEEFREVDVIRLLELCLDEWLNFSEMLHQGVISQAFTSANYDRVKELHKEWGTLTKVWKLPDSENIDSIRDYFGEEVAFFFRWFAFYTRMLVPLAVFGFFCGSGNGLVATTLKEKRYMQVFFTFMVIGWASIYNTLFKHRAARERQRWGMKDHEESLLERAAFDPLLEGTFKLKLRNSFARVFPIIYCAIFVLVVLGNEYLKKLHRMNSMRWIKENRYLSTVVLIKAFSLLWTRIAPRLAEMQNHRTQGRWNNALIGILGSVKLFVTLFPFIHEAFLKGYIVDYCAPTLAEAAFQVYGSSNSWPKRVPHPGFVNGTAEVGSNADLSWLHGHYRDTEDGGVCIFGCFPHTCFPRHHRNGTASGFSCVTNCIVGLESSLKTVYLLHVGCTVAILLIPIALTRIAVEREVVKEKAEGKYFSLLQLQAKCCEYASYEYMSWGGSQVEDFLELAIGFALLTCFGIVLPDVAVIALFSHIVEYRLLAYRMTNITCRPFPFVSEGIGTWQIVFEGISIFAVATNVGLAVTQMYPMRSWPADTKLGAFVLMEHSLAFVYIVLTYVLSADPWDVKRVDDFNVAFKRKNAWRKPVKVPRRGSWDCSKVDISVVGRADSYPEAVMAREHDAWL